MHFVQCSGQSNGQLSGAALRTTIDHGSLEHPDGIASRTTRETTITDWLGHDVMTERFVKTETGFERIDWTYHSYNTKGRLIETLHANHTRTETGWGCCGKADSTDASGITSRYGYDDLGRNTSVFNEATGLHTEFTYDAAGRRLSTTERNGELTRATAARYDLSGRLLATTDPAGLVTTFFHAATETALLRPGGAEEITRNHHDGSLRSQTEEKRGRCLIVECRLSSANQAFTMISVWKIRWILVSQ